MNTKTTLRFRLILVRMAKINKNRRQHVLGGMCGKGNTHSFILAGVQACVATIEISVADHQEAGNRSTLRSSYTTPEHVAIYVLCFMYVHSCSFHNSQKISSFLIIMKFLFNLSW